MKTFSDTARKNMVSILVGPIAVVPAMFLMLLVSAILNSDASANTDWSQVLSIYGIASVVIAYILTVIFALPLVLLLQKFKVFNFFSVIASAVLISLVITLMTSGQFLAFLILGYFSIIIAVACWFVHKRV